MSEVPAPPGPGPGFPDPDVPPRASRAAAKRTLRRSAKILAVLFAVNYLVLPQIAGARKAVSELLSVEPAFLVLGVGLQVGALLAYTQLTRAALPSRAVPFWTLFRIQLATKAVTNTVPGGSAAGSALGYRLLTTAGVRGADAGFALATAGLGSAVVLNLILWLGLLVSIPANGFSPLYGIAALVGVVVMALFAAIVVGLMKGQARAEQALRAVARRVRVVDEERVGAVVRRIAERLRELASDPALLRRVVFWAATNWVLDAASLWVFVRAFGASVPVDGLIVAFGLANVMAVIPITPGGLGIVEGVMIPTLVAFGVPRSVALVAIPMYRLAQFWLPIPLGGLAYVSLRVGPFSLERSRRLPSLVEELEESSEVRERRLGWDNRQGTARGEASA